jgi:hypothetical protein
MASLSHDLQWHRTFAETRGTLLATAIILRLARWRREPRNAWSKRRGPPCLRVRASTHPTRPQPFSAVIGELAGPPPLRRTAFS